MFYEQIPSFTLNLFFGRQLSKIKNLAQNIITVENDGLLIGSL